MNGWLVIKRSLLALLLGVSVQVVAAESVPVPKTAKGWLDRVPESASLWTYRGVLVYQVGARLETLAVTHDVDKGVVKERVFYLDGLPREMVRNGDKLTYSTLNNGVTHFEHGSLVPMLGKFADIASGRFYQVGFARQQVDRVAGREAAVIDIVPADRYRYGYRLWVDAQSGLLLKSIMLDSQSNIIERLQFTHIEPGVTLSKPEVAAMDKSNIKHDNVITMQDAASKGGIWGWEAGWIPDGFTVQSASQRPSPVSKHKTDAVIYSDGIASFSVFVEPDETRVLSQAAETIGALAAVSKVFRNGETYFHVTVVGEVPLGTAERVAVSVRPAKVPETNKTTAATSSVE